MLARWYVSRRRRADKKKELRISFHAETPITHNQVGREDEIKVPGRHQRLPFIAAARAIIIDNRCVPGSSSRFFSFI